MTLHRLYGRVILRMDIEAVTGLHIGGAGADLEIGGVDKTVIRDPLTNQPYIPGSSLRGKMRSQMEKLLGLPQNRRIGRVYIHTCEKEEDFLRDGGCPVCTVFGVPAELPFANPTRLVVRDVHLAPESAKRLLEEAFTDRLYTETKVEVAIDRVTSMANPRTMERVPAGAVFGPAEMVFNIHQIPQDFDRLGIVLQALQAVEDDYLGGSGSRGYGKVRFRNIKIFARRAADYTQEHEVAQYDDLSAWAADFVAFRQKVAQLIAPNGG